MFQMRDIWRLDINKAGSAIYLKAKITFVFIEELSTLQHRAVHVIFERILLYETPDGDKEYFSYTFSNE